MIKPCFYKIGRAGVTNIPKCGSQTLESISEGCFDDVSLVDHQVAFLRDPIDRLKSLYSFINEYVGLIVPYKIHCWQCFVEWVLETDNDHAKPQSEFLYGTEDYYLLDDMDDVLNQLVGLTPIQKHKTSLIAPYNDYKLAEIKSKYAKDFELMERLNGS